MKQKYFLFFITFILAFCSIVYELILAQTLTAFLDNTVLRYSITIGLYLFALGFGALIAEGRALSKPLNSLQQTELWLSLIGGFSVIFVFLLNSLHLPDLFFLLLIHGLIIAIGILSGFELPLLINLAKRFGVPSENTILAFNYIGAFGGTVCFAFFLYPIAGLITASILVGILNAFIGITSILLNRWAEESKAIVQSCLILQVGILLLLIFYLCNLNQFNPYLINMYLK